MSGISLSVGGILLEDAENGTENQQVATSPGVDGNMGWISNLYCRWLPEKLCPQKGAIVKDRVRCCMKHSMENEH